MPNGFPDKKPCNLHTTYNTKGTRTNGTPIDSKPLSCYRLSMTHEKEKQKRFSLRKTGERKEESPLSRREEEEVGKSGRSQEATMEEVARLAWCAGFLDGEGSFTTSRVATSQKVYAGYERRKPIIVANQIHEEPLLSLRGALGGSVKALRVPSIAGNVIYRWEVKSAYGVAWAIRKLLPFLVLKREIAELLLDFSLTFQMQGLTLSDEVLSLREGLQSKIKSLNFRGNKQNINRS
jgi:hypothetical protein